MGSDVAFLNGLMNVIIAEGLYDEAFVRDHTEGFEELKTLVARYPWSWPPNSPESARTRSGRSPGSCGTVKPGMVCYTLGITEHTSGRNNVVSIANLQMLLGNLGMAHGGVNPLRGQNNVQGACDMGALPNVLPGYQRVVDPAVREKFARFWGVPELPEQDGADDSRRC